MIHLSIGSLYGIKNVGKERTHPHNEYFLATCLKLKLKLCKMCKYVQIHNSYSSTEDNNTNKQKFTVCRILYRIYSKSIEKI